MGRKPFLVWMSLQALFVIAIAVFIDVVNRTSSISHNARFRLIRGIIYGVISGDLSAHALLFAKSAVELLIKTIGGKNQFIHWESWVIVLALVALALCQLYYLHRGLKLVSTSVLYPLVFCVYNIIAILDGLIYFDQTSLISPLRACLIALGTLILLTGVLALSWRLSDEQHTPGVGQSSLAPGLGLVEDTDGEEESLLGSDEATAEDQQPSASYETFPRDISVDTTPMIPTRKKSFRWAERAEIWGELEDQDEPTTPTSRHRSSTLPARSESTPLLPGHRRSISGGGASVESGPSTEQNPRRATRRRRKSTGFPGLVARRQQLKKRDSSLTGSLSQVLTLKWWRGQGDRRASSSSGIEGGTAFPRYRDNEDENDEAPGGSGPGIPNDSAV